MAVDYIRINREEAQALYELMQWAQEQAYENGCYLDPFHPLTSARDKIKPFIKANDG